MSVKGTIDLTPEEKELFNTLVAAAKNNGKGTQGPATRAQQCSRTASAALQASLGSPDYQHVAISNACEWAGPRGTR